VERFDAVLPVGDVDVGANPSGIVVSGWYDPGLRPNLEATPAVPWITRDGGAPDPHDAFSYSAAFDSATGAVVANGWMWFLDDFHAGSGRPPVSAVVATHDGGFLALVQSDDGTAIWRGWRDGNTARWDLPSERASSPFP